MFALSKATFQVYRVNVKTFMSCASCNFSFSTNLCIYNHRMLSSAVSSKSRSEKMTSSFLTSCRVYSSSSEPLKTNDDDEGHVPSFYDRYVFPEPPDLVSEEEHDVVVNQVQKCLADPEKGRLFAVVFVAGKQYKVTDFDLIRTDGSMLGVDIGERIRLEKVLLVGGKEFTLVGRPILKRSLVKVEATVIEKTPGVDKVIQRFTPRKNFQRRYCEEEVGPSIRINSFPEAKFNDGHYALDLASIWTRVTFENKHDTWSKYNGAALY